MKVLHSDVHHTITDNWSFEKARNIFFAAKVTRTSWQKQWTASDCGCRHRIDAYESANDDDLTLTLSLRIRIFDDTDYGRYTCFASNRFGHAEASMMLYGELACACVCAVFVCTIISWNNETDVLYIMCRLYTTKMGDKAHVSI